MELAITALGVRVKHMYISVKALGTWHIDERFEKSELYFGLVRDRVVVECCRLRP
jgi:hypothetical protein